MNKEKVAERLWIIKQFAIVIWAMILVPFLYSFLMWACLVVSAWLVLKDFWTAAGAVSAYTLFQIVNSEFRKEFFGDRKHGL